MEELVGTLIDPVAARCMDLVAAAQGADVTAVGAWLELGAILLPVREQMPEKQEFGRWCKQNNYFGAKHRQYLTHAMNAAWYCDVTGVTSPDVGVRELSKLARAHRKQLERTPAPALPAGAATVDLRVGDFRDVLADVVCDAIITDPPYPAEYLPLYADLAKWADDVLPDHGVLAVMVGQSYLPQLLQLMDGHRPYRWTLAYLTPGGQATQLWTRNVNTFWKPVLLYGHVNKATGWVGDVTRSAVNDNDKDHHHWGQSVSGMVDLVERLTEPGQTVCDPFMGAATTGVACQLGDRNFIGCDIDPGHVDTARGRFTT